MRCGAPEWAFRRVPGKLPPVSALDAVIALGSNLGDRVATLQRAVGALAGLGRLVATSFVYETAPVGPPQPDFLNAAVRLLVQSSPLELLAALMEIERAAGRERRERWGPRTLDLDILWIRGLSLETTKLTVPHAELRVRPFALVPLLDVAPEATDPRTGVSYAAVLATLDSSSVRMRGELSVSGSVLSDQSH